MSLPQHHAFTAVHVNVLLLLTLKTQLWCQEWQCFQNFSNKQANSTCRFSCFHFCNTPVQNQGDSSLSCYISQLHRSPAEEPALLHEVPQPQTLLKKRVIKLFPPRATAKPWRHSLDSICGPVRLGCCLCTAHHLLQGLQSSHGDSVLRHSFAGNFPRFLRRPPKRQPSQIMKCFDFCKLIFVPIWNRTKQNKTNKAKKQNNPNFAASFTNPGALEMPSWRLSTPHVPSAWPGCPCSNKCWRSKLQRSSLCKLPEIQPG